MKNGVHVDRWGTKRWYLSGVLHREDGSAIIFPDGDKWWCRNGIRYIFDDWLNELETSEEDKLLLKLKWA